MTTREERARGISVLGEYTPKKLADEWGVAHGTFKRWLHEGMPARRIGNNEVWVMPEPAMAWLEKKQGRTIAFNRRSVVYFAERMNDNAIKIGFTSDVMRRVHELRKKQREAVELIACFPGSKPDELHLHRRFARSLIGEEWFKATPALREFISNIWSSK
jgi:hypothetical protein